MRCLYASVFFLLGVTNALIPAPDRNHVICKPWACIQESFGIDTSSSSRNITFLAQLETIIARQLTDLDWELPVQRALDICLNAAKPRRYSNTCPGQETWHCIVDQLIDNCPESKLKKEDACTPVASLLGVNYLFLQNTYSDIDRNLESDKRPPWFLRNYLSSKCCDLPALFGASELQQCNVTTFMRTRQQQVVPRSRAPSVPPPHAATATESFCAQPLGDINPLECCDTSEFIPSNVYGECGVRAEWYKDQRIVLKELESASSTTEAATTVEVPVKKHNKRSDIKVHPVSCAQQSCVFGKVGVVSAAGVVDRDAFAALLDDMAREHGEWSAARARVVSRCLRRDVSHEYDADCDVGRILACALDVLAENCPNIKKGSSDPCRHSSLSQNTTAVCQVSISKFRRNRHRYCDVPRLVPASVLSTCGVTSLSRLETAERELPAPPPRTNFKFKSLCVTTSNATTCMLSKLGLLNRYGFLDGVKLAARAEAATRAPAWRARAASVAAALRTAPLYRDHCTSQKKVLNLIDAAVTNCPLGKKKYSIKCVRFFDYLNRCTNSTSMPKTATTNIPAGQSASRTPIFVRFPTSYKTLLVHAKAFQLPKSAVSVQTRYAPGHSQYIPGSTQITPLRPAFSRLLPPIASNSYLAAIPLAPSAVYSPSHSHMLSEPAHSPFSGALPPDARPIPYSAYYNDGFRSASNPFLLHDKIASAHRSAHASRAERTTRLPDAAAGAPEPARLKVLLPIESQVYE